MDTVIITHQEDIGRESCLDTKCSTEGTGQAVVLTLINSNPKLQASEEVTKYFY